MSQHAHARSHQVSPYPGVRNPYNRHPLQESTIAETTPAAIDAASASSIVPYADPTPVTSVAPVAASTSKFPFNIGDIKGFIDRMGGIDGIVSTMSKVQKVMQSVSQMAPVMKLMADTLLPGKKKDNDDDDWSPPRRRRRRKRKTTNKSKQRRRPTSSKSKGHKSYKR